VDGLDATLMLPLRNMEFLPLLAAAAELTVILLGPAILPATYPATLLLPLPVALIHTTTTPCRRACATCLLRTLPVPHA